MTVPHGCPLTERPGGGDETEDEKLELVDEETGGGRWVWGLEVEEGGEDSKGFGRVHEKDARGANYW